MIQANTVVVGMGNTDPAVRLERLTITDTTLSNCSYSTALRVVKSLFCNPETGDYTLYVDSPLIQGGEVLYVPFPSTALNAVRLQSGTGAGAH